MNSTKKCNGAMNNNKNKINSIKKKKKKLVFKPMTNAT